MRDVEARITSNNLAIFTLAEEEEMTLDNTKTLMHILAPMESVERPQLLRVAAELAQRQGEYLACSQVIERAVEALYPDHPKAKPPSQMGMDDAYGDMTFPLG